MASPSFLETLIMETALESVTVAVTGTTTLSRVIAPLGPLFMMQIFLNV